MAKKTVATKPRNRKAQDTTLINLQALKKKIERLEFRITVLEKLAKFK